MEVKSVAADAIFRVFTACPNDVRTLIIDVRPYKEFHKKHVINAFCIRLSANGKVLLDYSKNQYDYQWSEDCWWDKHVLVYGDASLKKDHPVVAFLSKDNHLKTLGIFKEGFEALDHKFPCICTASIKSNAAKRYPSQLDSHLFLGDWSHAENHERLSEIDVKSIVTIHNNPGNLRPPPNTRHLKIEMADIDSADITPWFRPSYEFIEEARTSRTAVLVHCGAGVSRSAALCIAYLMRRNRWSAQKALEYAKGRRSLVNPNDGFWRSLCALEAQLGIADRSNPNAFKGFHGADAGLVDINEPKTQVTFVPAGKVDAAGGAAQRQLGYSGKAGTQSRSRSRSHDRRRRSEGERDEQRHPSGPMGDERRRRREDGDRRRRSRSRGRSRERGREREERRRSPASKDRRREAKPAVDLATYPGAVLEVQREGKLLGHLAIKLTRANQECVFGRLASCDVLLEHLSISRQHAQMTTDGAGNLFITDLGSAHGTNVDGSWIRANVPKQVPQGSTLQFGASSRKYIVAQVPQQVSGL